MASVTDMPPAAITAATDAAIDEALRALEREIQIAEAVNDPALKGRACIG